MLDLKEQEILFVTIVEEGPLKQNKPKDRAGDSLLSNKPSTIVINDTIIVINNTTIVINNTTIVIDDSDNNNNTFLLPVLTVS